MLDVLELPQARLNGSGEEREADVNVYPYGGFGVDWIKDYWSQNFKNGDIDKSTMAKRLRTRKPNSCILHTTGFGLGLERIYKEVFGKWLPNLSMIEELRNENTCKSIAEKYATRIDDVLQYKCQFLVGYLGDIYQLEDMNYFTWHTGGGNFKKYKKLGNLWDEKKKYKFWWNRFENIYKKPIDMECWENSSVNEDSWSIDILEPPMNVVGKNPNNFKLGYFDEQIESVIRLIRFLNLNSNVVQDGCKMNIWTHSQVDPFSRTNGDGSPWDLDEKRFDYDYIMDRCRE